MANDRKQSNASGNNADTGTAETVQSPAGRELRIWFRKPETLTDATLKANAADGKGTTLARCDIDGLFGPDMPLSVRDFAISLKDRTMTVYMPATGPRGFYKHVGPRVIPVPDTVEIYDATGNRLTHTPDPVGVRAQKRLESAIIDAWDAANRACTANETPYDRPWPLVIAAAQPTA